MALDLGNDLLSGGASAILKTFMEPQSGAEAGGENASEVIRRLVAERTGGQSGITFGPAPGQPNIPLPPTERQATYATGNYQSSGERKRAESAALMSTLSSVVKGAEQKHYQQKVQKLQIDIQTLMGAISGYKEAETSQNKEAMDHNSRIINSITSDPKKAKEISKAFDIDLNPLAEKKGKKEKQNPAQEALVAAFKKNLTDYQQKKTDLTPQAQQFMQGMPQQAQADPRLAIMAQLTKAGVLPQAKDELEFTQKLMEISQKAQDKGLDRESRQELATMLANAKGQQAEAQVMSAAIRAGGMKEAAQIRADALNYRTDKVYKGIVDNPRWKIMQQKLSDDKAKNDPTLKGLNDFTNMMNSQIKNLGERIKAAKAAKDTKTLAALQSDLKSLQQMQQMGTDVAAKKIGLDPQQIDTRPSLDEDQLKELQLLFGNDEQNATGSDSTDNE